jgi:hypothetical protein
MLLAATEMNKFCTIQLGARNFCPNFKIFLFERLAQKMFQCRYRKNYFLNQLNLSIRVIFAFEIVQQSHLNDVAQITLSNVCLQEVCNKKNEI